MPSHPKGMQARRYLSRRHSSIRGKSGVGRVAFLQGVRTNFADLGFSQTPAQECTLNFEKSFITNNLVLNS